METVENNDKDILNISELTKYQKRKLISLVEKYSMENNETLQELKNTPKSKEKIPLVKRYKSQRKLNQSK